MTSSAGSNVRLITLSNAAPFPNNVLVIDIGTGQLGGAPRSAVEFDNQADQALVNVSIDPALDNDDEIIAATNGGYMAAGGGDDLINLQACFNAFGNCPTFEKKARGGPGDEVIKAVNNAGELANLVMTAHGGSGNDTITANHNGAKLFVDTADGESFTPQGTLGGFIPAMAPGDDTLPGGTGADQIDGGPGDERLKGGEGDDSFDSGAGDDRAVGGEGQ